MKRGLTLRMLAVIAGTGILLAVSPAGAQSAPPPDKGRAAAAADAHVAQHGADVHKGPEDRMIRTGVKDGTDGLQYVTYERTYRSLPVVGGDAVVMTNAAGRVLSTSAAQDHEIKGVSTKPTVRAADARETSRKQLARVDETSEPRLVILAWGKPRLAWETVVTGATDKAPSKTHVFVDARTGAVADSYDEVRAGSGAGYYNGSVTFDTSGSSGSYSMTDGTRPGIKCGGQGGTAYTGSDDNWGNGTGTSLETACVDAMYAVQEEWDMLGQWLGRDGIDGRGGGFPARVGLSQVNAYWNGSYTNFGHSSDNQRQLTPIDVVSHEYGHAIFQTTPGGAGSGNENGGLNEGTGDIFAAMTEHYANNPNDPADYLVGEEANLTGNGPIRNMYDPSVLGDPNCYSSAIPNTEVHAAAGPLNHWFYLASEGSNPGGGKPSSPICSGGPSSVTGVGLQTASKIYYNAMQQKTSTWTYSKARTASLTAAKNMFPGSCAEFDKVKAAWNAVTVPAQSTEPTCTPDSTNDFSVSVSPTSGSVDGGASTTATVSTATTRGDAQSVAFSASGLPVGVTASFNPTSVTSGGTSTVTFTAAADAASGTYPVTITGTGNGISHATTYNLTVNGVSTCGGYERSGTGSLSANQVGYQPSSSGFSAVSGTHSACLDGPDATDFDLYLQRWNGSSWVDVAEGVTSGPDEKVTYNGTSGSYRWQVHAYSGSGNYAVGYNTP